jgi:hypothetical protein
LIESLYAYVSLLFGITLFVIIRQVRLQNLKVVKSALKNPLWPRTKISFFINIYRTYYEIKGLNFVIILNILCFIVGIISLIIDFTQAIKSNLM